MRNIQSDHRSFSLLQRPEYRGPELVWRFLGQEIPREAFRRSMILRERERIAIADGEDPANRVYGQVDEDHAYALLDDVLAEVRAAEEEDEEAELRAEYSGFEREINEETIDMRIAAEEIPPIPDHDMEHFHAVLDTFFDARLREHYAAQNTANIQLPAEGEELSAAEAQIDSDDDECSSLEDYVETPPSSPAAALPPPPSPAVEDLDPPQHHAEIDAHVEDAATPSWFNIENLQRLIAPYIAEGVQIFPRERVNNMTPDELIAAQGGGLTAHQVLQFLGFPEGSNDEEN